MSIEEQFREIVRSVIQEEFAPILEAIEQKNQSPAGKLISIADAMERLDLSRTTIYAMRQRGELKAVNIGGAVRFREEDINALLEN